MICSGIQFGAAARRVGALLLLAVLASPAWSADNVCLGGERVRPVTAWGSPATSFSAQPAVTLEDLQALVNRYESDLRQVLEQAGWGGNPDDLFATVRDARPGGDTITVRQVQPGAEFEWMAYRKQGEAACVRSIMWAGKEPFPAWRIVVVSDDVEYTFMAPQACLNLAAEKGRQPVQPPSCQLSASFDREADRIDLRGSTTGARLEIISITTPAGAGDVGDLQSTGAGRWTYPPSADGRHEFGAVATSASGRQTGDCSAAADVTRKKPECRLSASVDPATRMISVSSAGSVGETTLTGVSLWDGSAGDTSALRAAGEGVWTFDAGATLPKKPGDYRFGFEAVSSLHGYEASCDAAATVTKGRRADRWIVRGFAARADTSGDEVRDEPPTIGPQVRAELGIGNGSGFGGAVEYQFHPRWGLELDALFLDIDSRFMLDIDDLWGSDEQNLGFTPISLGLNYHLTPERRVDVFLGAFVSRVMYDDVTYRALGESFRAEIDDDTGFGAKLGIDVPFGWESPWAATGSVRYLATSAEGGDNVKLDVDPMIFTLGLAYRF